MPKNQATWVDTKQDELRAVGAFVLHVQVIRLIMTLKKKTQRRIANQTRSKGFCFVFFFSFAWGRKRWGHIRSKLEANNRLRIPRHA